MEDILYLKSLERIKKETVYEKHILDKIDRLQVLLSLGTYCSSHVSFYVAT